MKWFKDKKTTIHVDIMNAIWNNSSGKSLKNKERTKDMSVMVRPYELATILKGVLDGKALQSKHKLRHK